MEAGDFPREDDHGYKFSRLDTPYSNQPPRQLDQSARDVATSTSATTVDAITFPVPLGVADVGSNYGPILVGGDLHGHAATGHWCHPAVALRTFVRFPNNFGMLSKNRYLVWQCVAMIAILETTAYLDILQLFHEGCEYGSRSESAPHD